MKVGVLALQGDFDAHRRRLQELGASATLVRKPAQLDEVEALVIPGGESSTLLWHLEQHGFFHRLAEFVRARPTFGTCAGAILLASEVANPPQKSLGAMNISVERNAYGRQINSFIGGVHWTRGGDPLEAVFIRAPRITSVGEGVEVLASEGSHPVLVQQGHLMAATFHPELSADKRVHAAFLELIGP
ncbi:MAG: pyridoxal 5'-phosphate synthase glutaminase subunit PdxT [Acidobacteria bacterium]|nr:pyridoxal 5'-phosphate synthase glutaminase subunit PdxT [Acidobacteriota bacterium]